MNRPHGRPRHDSVVDFHGMVTSSPRMQEVFRLIERAARRDVTVLIRGETGTGKELVARALHHLSARRSRPYRAVNCASLRGDHLASELFGHVRGAFTGAVSDRDGVFSICHGGTLFLDEIAELGSTIQPQLLRVLQEQTFIPLGGTKPQRVDVRLVAATNRALRHEVAEGRFRADLMYRVRVAPLYLPPLRDRGDDVELLARHFLRELAEPGHPMVEVSDEALAAMRAYPWPGNVRELRNAIEAALTFGDGPVLMLEHLPPELRGERPSAPPESAVADPHTLERRRILDALRSTGGRKAEAAELLGLSRSTLWRRMRELALSWPT